MATAGTDDQNFEQAPRLLDVSGRRLCVRVRGNGPTVVLEGAGTGDGIDGGWGERVERGLLEMATVLEYDRRGVGHSEGRQPSSIGEMADDLHAMVRASGVVLPAVFVGWSYGGLVLTMHALRYPEDVAGLVLVDPTPAAPAPGAATIRRTLQFLGVGGLWLTAAASALGLFRTGPGRRMIARGAGESPTPEMLRSATDYFNSPRAIAAMARMLGRLEQHQRELDQAVSGPDAAFPDVPTVVLTAGVRPVDIPPRHREHLEASHARLAALAPAGEVVVAERSGHQLPYDQPELLLEQIATVLERTGNPELAGRAGHAGHDTSTAGPSGD